MNYEIRFVFNGMNIDVPCKKEEKIKNIFNKIMGKLDIGVNDVYLLLNGLLVDFESTLEEYLTPINSSERKINILIYKKDDLVKSKKKEDTLSKYIICPKCGDNCLMEIVDYKINFYYCKNYHNTKNISLDEFNNTQKINEETIICSECGQNKKDVYGNNFYFCLTCKKNFCPLCSSSHNKIHKSIINYDEKHFICNTHHNESFISFCKDCKENLCFICDGDHNNHAKIKLNSIMPDIDKIKKKIENFKSKINKMKTIIEEIIEKIQKVYNSMELYYKIINDIVNKYDMKKRNYYDFQNLNNIEKNLQLNEIDKITNFNSSLVNILKNLGIIYIKLTNNLKESKDSETESFKANGEKVYIKKNKLYKTNNEFKIQYKIDQNCKKIKIFGQNFVENNSENFVFIYDDDEYKLAEYLDVEKIKKIDKDILEIKLQVIKNNIINLSDMFSECSLLYSLPDICFLDTSNVTNMNGMFLGCKSLNYLSDISKWNTSNVESMNGMFNGCSSLSFLPDISAWDVSNVTDMSYMFWGCKSISNFPDISDWNVNKVKNYEMMFRGCPKNIKIPDKLNIK